MFKSDKKNLKISAAVLSSLIISLMAVVVLLILSGCGKSEDDNGFKSHQTDIKNNIKLNDYEGVSLTARDISPTGGTFRMRNDSDKELIYGDDYDIQEYRDGGWYKLEKNSKTPDGADIVINDIGYSISPGEEQDWNYSWIYTYEALPVGKYRIIKDFFEDPKPEDPRPLPEYYVAAEFEISDETEYPEYSQTYTFITRDIDKITEFTGVEIPTEVLRGKKYVSSLKSLEVYTSLVDSLYDLPYWKALGTAEVVFDFLPSKTKEEVVVFIDGGSQRGFESLFEPFFWEDYNDPETIEYAKSLAYYLTKYSVENHSFEEFMNGDYREEWLSQAGSNSEYVHDDYSQLLENAKFGFEDGVHTIHIGEIKWVCKNAEWIPDAGTLYDLIHDIHRDFDSIKEDIIADAPVWYDAHKFPDEIIIEFYDDDESDNMSSYTDNSENSHFILVSGKADLPHELVHALTSRTKGTDTRWLCEGIAEYYSDKYRSEYYREMDNEYVQHIISRMEDELDETEILEEYDYDHEYAQYAIDYIYDMKAIYQELKSLYPDKYYELYYVELAQAGVEIERDDDTPEFNYSVTEAYSDYEDHNQGQSKYVELDDRVSYDGAMVLTGMLIKEYGADMVLEYLHTGGNFKRRFEMISEEFYQKVREEGIDYSVFF